MQVRPLKMALKYFANEYGKKREILREDILYIQETLKLEDEKHEGRLTAPTPATIWR